MKASVALLVSVGLVVAGIVMGWRIYEDNLLSGRAARYGAARVYQQDAQGCYLWEQHTSQDGCMPCPIDGCQQGAPLSVTPRDNTRSNSSNDGGAALEARLPSPSTPPLVSWYTQPELASLAAYVAGARAKLVAPN